MTDTQNTPPEPPEAPHNDPNQEAELNPGDPQHLQPNMLDLRSLRTAQILAMVSTIAGPVSFFFGGTLLSTVGLVCGFIGYRKIKAVAAKKTDAALIANRLKTLSVIGMVGSAVALILNVVALVIMFPVVMEALETGDYAGLMADAGSGAISSNSTWG